MSLVFYALFPQIRSSVIAGYVVILVSQFLVIALPSALYLRRARPEAFALRRRRLPFGACLCLLLGGVSGMFAVNGLTLLWIVLMEALGLPSVGSGVPIPETSGQLWLSLLVVGIAPALCEELLFRGLALPSFERLGTRRAVLLSALLFALMHGQITALPVHLVLGVLLGALLVGYGSIWAPMLFHASFNGVSMLISFLQSSSPATELPYLTPTTAELAVSYLPILLFAGLLTVALIWTPMKAFARKSSPPRFQASGEKLSAGAITLLITTLILFVLEYGIQMLAAASRIGQAT